MAGARQNDLNPNTYIGLALPLKSDNNNVFQLTKSSYDQVRHNLKNLLLTHVGERVYQPEFGSRLREICFEQYVTEGNLHCGTEGLCVDGNREVMILHPSSTGRTPLNSGEAMITTNVFWHELKPYQASRSLTLKGSHGHIPDVIQYGQRRSTLGNSLFENAF